MTSNTKAWELARVATSASRDIKAALVGGVSPYLAEVIKKFAPDESSRVMAHIVLGAVSAELQGGNALAGASGAGISAAGAEYIKTQLYGDRSVEQLTEQEKQTVTALATLAGGLAGGIVGGDTSSVNHFTSSVFKTRAL
jgi:filamentous hemagglutinin